MVIRRWLFIALTALTAACAAKQTAHESRPPAQLPGLCAALSIAEVQATYRSPVPPLDATRHLDDAPYHHPGMATCHYGATDDLGGVVLGIPLGDPVRDPVRDIAELIGGSYARDGKDLTLGPDKAFFLTAGAEASIAVAHGPTQFVLTWRPLSSAPADRITQEQLTRLATQIASRMPTNFVLPQQDIADECSGLQSVAEIVGGQVVMARGSANPDTLNCDYLGPAGIVKAGAIREPDREIDHQIRSLRGRPLELVNPPVADDVVLSATTGRSLRLDGFLNRCCSLRFRYRSVNESADHSGVFDAAQRQFVGSFADAARTWRVRT